jgi:hypothetical protein
MKAANFQTVSATPPQHLDENRSNSSLWIGRAGSEIRLGVHDSDFVVHASHAADGQDRFLGHLLVEVRSEYSGEHNVVLAKFDSQVAMREIRVVRQGVLHFSVKSPAGFGRAATLRCVANLEGTVVLHERADRGWILAGKSRLDPANRV